MLESTYVFSVLLYGKVYCGTNPITGEQNFSDNFNESKWFIDYSICDRMTVMGYGHIIVCRIDNETCVAGRIYDNEGKELSYSDLFPKD
jgi:hypothetical protein